MPNLLLELFSEEIPATMQLWAENILYKRLEKALNKARLDFVNIKTYSTPRRIAVIVEGLPKVQPDLVTQRKGPKISAPAGAINGFCKSCGVDIADLEKRTKNKDIFYFANIKQEGRKTADTMQNIIENIIVNFPWEKSQKWGDSNISWVRPLRNILCLLDDVIIPVQFGHLTANNMTFGHRFLSNNATIIITNLAEYNRKLADNFVIIDRQERKEKIIEQANKLVLEANLKLKQDDDLLNEVAGLVEYPTCLLGNFDKEFLKLPAEVLVLEMRNHQKYFAVTDMQDKISNHFIATANINAQEAIKGNERVLRARLSDGRFYWDIDRKTPLIEWVEKLKNVIFHAKLGTIYEKTKRIASLSTFIAVFVPHANLEKTERAASLCKADLACNMVGEFSELQGIMGRYYAILDGEDMEIAEAIAEHYLPIGANSQTPKTPVGISVALADKIDSLVGLFSVGEKPTGSKDPFALRRATLGVIRIILDNGLRMPLRIVLENAASRFETQNIDELMEFFADRLKVMLRDENIRHDYIAAIFDGEDDLVCLLSRVKSLEEFLNSFDGANLLTAYNRTVNILKKEEKKDKTTFDGKVNKALLLLDIEKDLYDKLENINIAKLIKAEYFTAAMQEISTIRPFVDNFFDEVKVNDKNEDLRNNRLNLLAYLRNLLKQIGNLELIEG